MLRASIICSVLLMTGASAAADSLRDPTRPYHSEPNARPGVPSFVVNAIFLSADRQVAIVNGVRVGVGDTVAGARVVAISKNSVTLGVGDQTVVASLRSKRT